MNLTPEELAAAKRQLAKIQRTSDPNLSDEDRQLMKKYPRHTLEAARLIDGTTPSVTFGALGYTTGFEKLVAQERGNFHLSGDHT